MRASVRRRRSPPLFVHPSSDLIRSGQTLAQNYTLNELDLSKNEKLWSKGFGVFAWGLARNRGVTILGLAQTTFFSEHMEPLAEALTQNSTLTSLDLAYNAVEDVGAKSLAECLSSKAVLKALDLSWNKLLDPALVAFAQSVQLSTSLQTVILRHNGSASGLVSACVSTLVPFVPFVPWSLGLLAPSHWII